MKTKKIFMAILLLLAILTIGSVSASEGADDLAVEESGGEDLSLDDESSSEVIASEGDEDIGIDIIGEDFPLDGRYHEHQHSIAIFNVPEASNGTIKVLSGESEIYSRALKDFNTDDILDNGKLYGINYHDLSKLKDYESGSLINVKFLNEDETTVISSFCILERKDDNMFYLHDAFNVWCWDEGWQKGSLYTDCTESVVNLDVYSSELNGVFYVESNGVTYRYEPNFDEYGEAWHNFALSSFNIVDPGTYNVTVRYASTINSPSEVIFKGKLHVKTFNNDEYRVVTSNEEQKVTFYGLNEDCVVKVYARNHGDEWVDNWYDYDHLRAHETYFASNMSNTLVWNYSGDLESLGLDFENGYDIAVNVTNMTGDQIFFYQNAVWCAEKWEPYLPSDVELNINDNSFNDGNEDEGILEVVIPEKNMVYEGTVEIKEGGTSIFTKSISTKDMDFDINGRFYRYSILFRDIKDLIYDGIFCFAFNYTSDSRQSLIMVESDDGTRIGRAFDINVWNNDWNKGPLYVDSNEGVIDININSQDIDGTFYFTVNGITYLYEPYFDDNGNAWHDWLLSSFNITVPGEYNVTAEYSDDNFQRQIVFKGKLDVKKFNNDDFRVTVDEINHLINLYCPAYAEGRNVSIFVKYDDWEADYPDPITYIIKGEDCNKWINWTFDELKFSFDEMENIFKVEVSDEGCLYEGSRWYSNFEEWDLFKPSNLTLVINNDDYREENGEDHIIELYVPETTFIARGTFTITSGDASILRSREISLRDMEFNEQNRFYYFAMSYDEFRNLNLNDEAILTVTFSDRDSSKNITKSFFYSHVVNEDDECDRFSIFKSNNVNLLRDEVVVEIVDFPDAVDDEFEIVIDKWREFVHNFKISELSKGESGLYTLNCTALKIDELMDGMNWIDFEVYFIFYRNGTKLDDGFRTLVEVFKNPDIHQGEISKDNGEPAIFFVSLNDLLDNFDADFTITVTNQSGDVLKKLTLNLNNMDKYKKVYDEDIEYRIELDDLGITENGIYNISMKFTKGGKDVYYNSTIHLVDYVIEKFSNLERITDSVFSIFLDEDEVVKAIIYVNETKVFDDTLTTFGYFGHSGSYQIPLNYLNITQSGNYTVKLEVYSSKGNRNVTHNIEVVVDKNNITFMDLMYAYGETNFVHPSKLAYPVPIDTEFVLYLNGKKAATTKISGAEFAFWNLDKSFVDEFGNIKPGSYDAKVELVINGNAYQTYEGHFNVLAKNGAVTVSVPATGSTTKEVYLSFSAPHPDVDDIWNIALIIYIDPVVGEDGFEWDEDSIIEIRGEDLEEFLNGKTHKFNLGHLPAGTHKIFVSYACDEDYERYMGNEFFSGFFTINIQKTATKFYGKAVTATYNTGKKLVLTLKDANGKLLTGVKVSIKVGTISKTVKTNKKGQISIDVSSLKPGKYSATVKFAGDGTYKASSLTVKNVVVKKAKPKFSAKTVKAKAKAKVKKVKVTLKHNKKGVKGKITLKINGIKYTLKTNKKGVAIFKVNKLTKKGKYVGKLSFKGDKYFTAASGKVKVIVK